MVGTSREPNITLDQSDISLAALKVVRRLSEEGFDAYLVGGCVRDLLLNQKPKDFDVATNATPQEVHRLFRNSRIIGRRFQIAHVRFGREIIEVATFRGQHDPNQSSESGHVLRDNVFGSFEEDGLRRDFTVNALYYDAISDTILDPTGKGLADLQAKKLNLIGDPEIRFQEDPVRMLRAVRFMAKLNFSVSADLQKQIRTSAHLLGEIPPARLFEETLKLFMNGHALSTFEGLKTHHLMPLLFPTLASEGQNAQLVAEALASTDARIAQDMPVTPAFLFAAFLWEGFSQHKDRLIKVEGKTPIDASHMAADMVFLAQQSIVAIPKRFSIPAREIWLLQDRLNQQVGKRPYKLLTHKRFRAAYDFLLLRHESGVPLASTCDWWTTFQSADPETQQQMTTPKRRKKRKKKTPKALQKSSEEKPASV
jgi:poly(A) polymerase